MAAIEAMNLSGTAMPLLYSGREAIENQVRENLMLFEEGRVYHRRSEIHATYGGQEQGGISTPAKYPYIFLFSGDSGEQYGYRDRWIDTHTFQYFGEGQRGDMQLLRGNLAVATHVEKGKEIHLFRKVDKGRYRYEGRFEYVEHDFVERETDIEGRSRTALVFTLRRVS